MSDPTGNCMACGRPRPEGRKTFCSKACQTAYSWKKSAAEASGLALEQGGLSNLQAQLVTEKRRVDSLTAENDSLRERIGVLEGQVFEHDIMIRELTRTLRALERKANEGESWKG